MVFQKSTVVNGLKYENSLIAYHMHIADHQLLSEVTSCIKITIQNQGNDIHCTVTVLYVHVLVYVCMCSCAFACACYGYRWCVTVGHAFRSYVVCSVQRLSKVTCCSKFHIVIKLHS